MSGSLLSSPAEELTEVMKDQICDLLPNSYQKLRRKIYFCWKIFIITYTSFLYNTQWINCLKKTSKVKDTNNCNTKTINIICNVNTIKVLKVILTVSDLEN